ncbi:hypothetical protein C2G38_2045524 [Gigaspora rosea]|uniref:Uncharacterized protein n=1 Tax=Gigaspora rosea TaxID=44941 RepID=A0A397UCF1_9GLOM|nr:hypothetical protein C2G38_2045524 [Gigaspora rosea]
MVDDISVECDNLVNNNNILDKCNNLINEYKNSLVNEYEYNLVNEYDDNLVNDDDNNLINNNNNNQVIKDNQDNQDNILHSILQIQPKNMSKTPNLKEIKLIPIMNHSGRSWIWSYYQRYEAVPSYKTINWGRKFFDNGQQTFILLFDAQAEKRSTSNSKKRSEFPKLTVEWKIKHKKDAKNNQTSAGYMYLNFYTLQI